MRNHAESCSKRLSFALFNFLSMAPLMTPYRNRLTPATRRMAEDMQIRNFAANTIDAYTWHVDDFLSHFAKPAEELGPEEIRQYQLYLVQEKKVGWSRFNQAVCGLRFFYRFTVRRDWYIKMIPYGKRPKKLPAVLGQAEVEDLLQCVALPKHRMVILTLYAAGLRLNEALHLKIADIDSQRMQLKVTYGKGAKQRLVPLSPRLLEELRQYWRLARPTSFLFSGRTLEGPLSSSPIQKTCKAAALQAGILKEVTPHTLRHSYATGLLEAGVDLLTIGQLLGHKSFSTTMVYLHVRRPHLNSIPSPIDWLPVRQCPNLSGQSPNQRDPR